MVRVLPLAALALVVVGGVAAGPESSRAGEACAGAPAAAPRGLPWPVVLETSCGRFRVESNGRVTVLGPSQSVPAGVFSWSPRDGTWWTVVDGHLVVGRWAETLWTSNAASFSPRRLGELVVGARQLAFSYGGGAHAKLYIAPLNGAEHLVATGEAPVAWAATGRLVTLSWHGGRLFARRDDGAGRRELATHVSQLVPAEVDGRLFFLARSRLMITDGGRPTLLARLSSLGLGNVPTLEAPGALVVLHDRHRLVVLRADGSRFASTRLPQWHKRTDGVSSATATDAGDDAIAFTATVGNSARGSAGIETTYVLRAGGTAATPVHRERVDFEVCERMASLEWHDRWLLYSASEGNVAAFDTAGTAYVDLTSYARKLPGATSEDDEGGEGGFNIEASWEQA